MLSPSSSPFTAQSESHLSKLWKEFFQDPSQFWDQRSVNKRNQSSPDFIHKETEAPLYMRLPHNPCWVQEELTKFGPENGKLGDLPDVLDLIKCCVKHKNLNEGRRLHADILLQHTFVLQEDIHIHNALINMYVKCGAIDEAQKMFEIMPIRNIVSWTVLIWGYNQHGFGHKAVECFVKMCKEGFSPDIVTFICILKACGGIQSLEIGEQIHKQVNSLGLLKKDVVLGTTLMDMYAKCGRLDKAQEVFDNLLIRNVVSWNALISGYANYGRGDEALKCFKKMQDEGLSPNVITFVCCLKACSSMGFVEIGKEIHRELENQDLLGKNIVLCNALLDMYVKCNMLDKAREVLEELPARDVVSWSTLISGYAQQGLANEALCCYKKMQNEGLYPDAVTFICLLKACRAIEYLDMGKEIHAEIVKKRLLDKNVVLATTLVDMYANCGQMKKAQEVFTSLPIRNVVTWNVLIAGYIRHGCNDEAICSMRKMQEEGIPPNAITFTYILKASGALANIAMGEEIHIEVCKRGLLKKNIILSTSLVDMYAKCGALNKAREIFDDIPAPNIVAWSALIGGYAQHCFGDEALDCFARMKAAGMSPDVVTFISLLKACADIGSLKTGETLHVEISNLRLLEKEHVLGTTLVNMYAKCGALGKAQEVFDELPVQDVATWNALIDGYAEQAQSEEALNCFKKMQVEGLSPPNEITYICGLKACGNIGSLKVGEEIHSEVCKKGLLLKANHALGTALIDMYAKCSVQEKAQEVFDEIPTTTITSWTALLAGYGQQGQSKMVFMLFSKMMAACIDPDLVTFLVLLNACSHAGLVDEGQMFFDGMNSTCSLTPTSEHYACMVDLFSRAGQFDKAVSVIETSPSSSDHQLLWLAILGSCAKWRNIEVARLAFEQLLQLDEKCTAAYICMGNVYM